VIRSSTKRAALLIPAVAAALLVVAGGLSAPAQIEEKQAEAELVLAQIQEIDSKLSKAVDAYNGASVRLAELEAAIETNRRHLSIARESNRAAQRNLEQRVVALYVSGGEEDVLAIIFGATSIDDLLDRIDAAERISRQDTEIVDQVAASRRHIRQRQAALRRALREQRTVVAERSAKRREIERRLVERQALYASIEDEIEQLEAEERERQRRLQREAERRLPALQRDAAAAEAPVPDPNGLAAVPPAPPSRYAGVAGVAMQYLGIPYVWGGSSPAGFDCSGFVMYVYAQMGVSLPHHAASQYSYGVPVSRGDLQPGDIVFFDGLGHNGIYIGGGQFVHSPHTGDVVKISSVYDSWYAATYVGARRIL